MTGPLIAVDVHTHLIPVAEGSIASQPGVEWDATTKTLTIDGHTISMARLFDAAALIEWMDQNNVQHAFISLPPPAYREELGAEESHRWADCVNDALRAVAELYPGRLTPLLHLPIQWPAVAALVSATAIAIGDCVFAAPTGAPGVQIADYEYEVLWQVLSDARAFLFMHPGSCADGRLESFYLTNLVGNPHETGIAIASLALGGVLDRFPGIQFCFAHGGGSAPMLAARLERGFATSRPGIDTSLSRPESLFGRVLVDCITHSEGAVALAESVFGESNVVFGSDWPFPMGILEPGTQLANWSPERRNRVCCSGAIDPKHRGRLSEQEK